jgi:hypothetical protein
MCELPPQFIIGYDREALQSSLSPNSPFKKKNRFNIILQHFHSTKRQPLYILYADFSHSLFIVTTQKSSY